MLHTVFQEDANGAVTSEIKNDCNGDVSKVDKKASWSRVAKVGAPVTSFDKNSVKITLPKDF